ncbi:MAG: methyltransferase domain-containing protein [Burkholderiaceae bacterium]|nr:methyltransferase domain-containing protein [Burkholderiaceae bacterium]
MALYRNCFTHVPENGHREDTPAGYFDCARLSWCTRQLVGETLPCRTSLFLPGSNLSIFELTRYRMTRWILLWRSGGGKQLNLSEAATSATFSVAPNSCDLVWSNLWLHEQGNPKIIVAEFWRLLREGGLLSFSYLGPDTGKELHALDVEVRTALGLVHLPSAWDMHDLGDALIAQRFAEPVMDMEYLDLQYDSAQLMLHDAHALGLLAKPINLENWQGNKSLLPKKLTLEIIYGHAWVVNKHLSKTQNQAAFISPDQIQTKRIKD